MNEELERNIEVTVSSPKVARAVKDSLERLKNGAGGPELQEIARDLLEGRISLRDLTRTSVYSNVLMDQMQRHKEWQTDLTAEQREQLEREVQEMYGPSVADGLARLRESR
jgi:flagellar biosynthesis component FlhA